MSSVSYNGKRLIPAPRMSIGKQFIKTSDGVNIGSTFQINLFGVGVSWKGSPTSSGTFHTIGGFPDDETSIRDDVDTRLRSIQRKQESLRNLFSQDGLTLEVQGADGLAPLKCNPRILSVDFPEEGPIQWVDRFSYNISMEADIVYGGTEIAPSGEDNFSQFITDAAETWTIETNDGTEFTGQDIDDFRNQLTYRLTHNISAVGKSFYDEVGNLVRPAWQEARDWVQPKLGLDTERITASGIINLPGYYGGFNHLRSENVGENDGSYSVTETWILSSGSALEDFTVEVRRDQSTYLNTVSINGTIQGLEEKDSSDFSITNTKYDNAATKFNEVSGLLLSRAQEFSGLTLNVLPKSEVIGRSSSQGFINYAYEYDDRASQIITGSLAEQIVIQDNLAGDIFASIPVLGRANGPVLQDMDTFSQKRRNLSINAVLPKKSPTSSVASLKSAFNDNPRLTGDSATDISNIITAASPASAGFTTVFQHDIQENYEPLTGVYSYATSWTYE